MSAEPRPALSAPRIGQAVAFGLLGLGLGLAMIGAKDQLYRVQGGVSSVAELLPFGYAYAAGMVAAFNPCGILLVPSLVAYYLGTDDDEVEATWWDRVGRALVFGVIASLGFVILFAGVGLLFVATGRAIGSSFPIGGLAIGVALAALGGWMLVTESSLGIASASRAMGHVRVEARPLSLLLFGVAYGVASLACTLPVFLVVVGSAVMAREPVLALAQFISYATGMGTMLTIVVVGAALFRSMVTRSIRDAMPYVQRVSASMLLGAGIFIIHYWLGPSGLVGAP
jgi:cytochrome c-type biogenesis protein